MTVYKRAMFVYIYIFLELHQRQQNARHYGEKPVGPETCALSKTPPHTTG